MDTQRIRVALWKADILQIQRRQRIKRAGALVGISALGLFVVVVLGIKHGWGFVLDWAVVTIPAILGFAAWVIPVKETQAKHKWLLFVGGLAFSGLIYFQQYLTRKAHANEMASLPTKKDIADIPDAVILKLRKEQVEAKKTEPGKGATIKPSRKYPLGKNQGKEADEPQISKKLDDIKSLIAGQHWGLSLEQLRLLSRRMAPYASEDDRGELITCIMGDPDSTKFAFSLVEAFRTAGWKLPGSGFSQAIFNGPVEGIIIVLNSKEVNPPGLAEFVATLREAGIQPVGQLDDKMPANKFRIIVGRKP
jgi:hypothetical protein